MSEYRKTDTTHGLVIGQAHLTIAGCAPVPVFNLSINTYTPFNVVYESGNVVARMRRNEPMTFDLEFQVNSKVLHSGHLWFVRFMNENNIQYTLHVDELNIYFHGPLSLEGVDQAVFDSMTYHFKMHGNMTDQKLPDSVVRETPKFVDGRPVIKNQPKPKTPPKRKVSFD